MSQDKPQTETQIINEDEVNTSPLLSMVVEKTI